MRCYDMRSARKNAVEIVPPTELNKLQDWFLFFIVQGSSVHVEHAVF